MSSERERLHDKFAKVMKVDVSLSRPQVSFQASKNQPFSWMRYKEAFSPELVNRFLRETPPGDFLDPFAGCGTALFAAAQMGWCAEGFEILPVGAGIMEARIVASTASLEAFDEALGNLKVLGLDTESPEDRFRHVEITKGAFPEETEIAMSAYLGFVKTIKDEKIQILFRFACMAILEDISYTRKDGQCLRWDIRAGRGKSKFEKPVILPFKTAIYDKLRQIRADILLYKSGQACGVFPDIDLFDRIKVYQESTLFAMSYLPSNKFDLIMTSPPYCNRYDYTRTYALELAFNGFNDDMIKKARQVLLSATVENRCKGRDLQEHYERNNNKEFYTKAEMDLFLHKPTWEVHGALMEAAKARKLNNENVIGMVHRYLSEMNLVIRQMARVLSQNGRVVMVNDNVQYGGVEIPIDLLLCDYAEMAGLEVEHILVLPKGKGNSSQQMGEYGRREIRKCIYLWKKRTKCVMVPDNEVWFQREPS